MFLGVWRRSSITQEILREWCSCEQVTLVENIGTPAFRRGDTCFEMFCVGLSTSQVEEALEAAKTMSGFDAGDACSESPADCRSAFFTRRHDGHDVWHGDMSAVQSCPDLSRFVQVGWRLLCEICGLHRGWSSWSRRTLWQLWQLWQDDERWYPKIRQDPGRVGLLD